MASISRRGRGLAAKIVVFCLLALVAVACADTPEGAALDQASDDFSCSESDLKILSVQPESDGSIVYRIWGCGHEGAYVCRIVHHGKSSSWECVHSAPIG